MSTQLDLFGQQERHEADLNEKRKAAKRKPNEQAENLARVYKGLKAALIAFRLNQGKGTEFTVQHLNEQLTLAGHTFAPDSPRRILNELQRDGAIAYEVVNRAKGIWKFTK